MQYTLTAKSKQRDVEQNIVVSWVNDEVAANVSDRFILNAILERVAILCYNYADEIKVITVQNTDIVSNTNVNYISGDLDNPVSEIQALPINVKATFKRTNYPDYNDFYFSTGDYFSVEANNLDVADTSILARTLLTKAFSLTGLNFNQYGETTQQDLTLHSIEIHIL